MEVLNTIDHNYPRDSEACCTEMFKYWLKNVEDASWGKLVEAVGNIGERVFANHLKEVLVYI